MVAAGPMAYAGSGYNSNSTGYDKDERMESHSMMSPMPDESGRYSAPQQQLSDGVPIYKIQCNDPLMLYIRDAPDLDTMMSMMDKSMGDRMDMKDDAMDGMEETAEDTMEETAEDTMEETAEDTMEETAEDTMEET